MTLRHRFAAGFRNAFSLGPPGPAQPTPEEADVIDRILKVIVKRQMTGPALLFLESMRPLSGVSSASIHYFAPFATALIDTSALRHMANFLDRRGSIEWICSRLEELEEESHRYDGETETTSEPE